MIQDNPYASPVSSIEELPIIQYKSRKQAIIVGIKKGAKFGGKCGAVIFLIMMIWGMILNVGLFIYAWRWKGVDPGYLWEKLPLLKMVGSGFYTLLFMILLGALTGALIMGTIKGIAYRSPKLNGELETDQNDS